MPLLTNKEQEAYTTILQALVKEAIPAYGENVTKVAVSIRNLGAIAERLSEYNTSLSHAMEVSIGQILSALPQSFVNDISCCEDFIEVESQKRMEAYMNSMKQIDNIIAFPANIKRGTIDGKNSG